MRYYNLFLVFFIQDFIASTYTNPRKKKRKKRELD